MREKMYRWGLSLPRLNVSEVEAAVRGEIGVFWGIPPAGRPGRLIEKLSSRGQRAFREARETGFVVCRGKRERWQLLNAWFCYCEATPQPLLRIWLRGQERSMIELDLSTMRDAEMDAEQFGDLWALLRGNARGVVQGGRRWLWADGVTTDAAEGLGVAIVEVLAELYPDGRA